MGTLVRVAPSEVAELFGILQAHASKGTVALELLTVDAFALTVFAPAFYFWWLDNEERKAVVNVSAYDPQVRSAEFGVVSLVPYKGHAHDAVTALLAFGFDALGLNRMCCKVNADNAECLAFVERNSDAPLRLEGVLRAARFKDGAFVDQHVYGMLEKEYRSWLQQ